MSNENPGQRRVTLSKADRETPAGRELVALLTELSADGQVTHDEMERLRAWLEVDRGVNFLACGFLYEVVDTIAADGTISEEELDSLALAIERVLPTDLRFVAALRRKERRAARRKERVDMRAAERAARIEERERAKPLHRADFVVAGAMRSAERREGCESLSVGESVILEREPDNVHDSNAILVLSAEDVELGYVPRQDAKEMASLLDSGAEVDATVKKLLQTSDDYVLPVIIATLRRATVPPSSTLVAPASDHRPPVALPQATPTTQADNDRAAPTGRPTPEWVDQLSPRKKLHPAIVAVTALAIATGMYFAVVVLLM